MEREEMELIQRLKNTKMIEDAANSELENAFSTPNPDPASFAAKNKKKTSASGMRSTGSRGGMRR